MVRVVMPVGMLVFERLVLMLVTVRLGKMQQHAGEHQRACDAQHPTEFAIPQQQRQGRADERSEGKDGPGPCGAERSLS